MKTNTSRKAPAGAAPASPGRNGYRYRQQFGIVVICENEKAQERAYNKLKRAGFAKLKVVAV